MKTRHALLIRAGIEAARLPHRLRAYWLINARYRHVHPLTWDAYRRSIRQVKP